jgi:uncharacterized repeat protein (TIGR02543 family)
MKKIFLFLFTLAVGITTLYANPKHEFRATWMTTGYGIDWPKTKATDSTKCELQKQELQQHLNALQAGNINAVCLQVRSFSDALYKSSYEPWAESLTGTRGQDPGYDPLAYAVEECHKRGIELHVWVNPFRVTDKGVLDTNDPVWKNAGQWIIKYNNSSFSGQIIDPGYPEARAYVHKVLMEIVNNYDIDGILMDDYFYAYGGTTTQDADSKSKYCYAWKSKVTNPDRDKDNSYEDDWRRANVDSVICNLYKAIQATKPWVRFGMGPAGNWTQKPSAATAYGISLPGGIRAMDAYESLYCNPVEWAKQGWVDYLNPQIYWSTLVPEQDYDVLCPWWAKNVCEHFSNMLPNGQRVHFFASQGACYVYKPDGMEGYSDGVAEIQRQINANRLNLSSGYTGSVFFSSTDYVKMYRDLRESHFNCKALVPPMSWKSKTKLEAPINLTAKDTILSWEHPTAERFTIYVYPRGTKGVIAKNNTATATIPTQEELWASFKTAAGLPSSLGTLAEINTGDMVASCKTICAKLNAPEVKNAFDNTDWTWLKDYLAKVQNAQKGNAVATSTVPELTDDLTAATWRYAIAAFFLQTQYTAWPYSADFTTAGQPSAWGPAYLGEDTGSDNNGDNTGNSGNTTTSTPAPEYLKAVVYGKSCRMDGWGDLSKLTIEVFSYDRYGVEHEAAHCESNDIYTPKQVIFWYLNGGEVNVDLPLYVTEKYVLPIPTKAGHDFVGWFKTNSSRGQKVTEIPAGYAGKLYAIWKKNASAAIENISLSSPIQVYDIMGRFVGTELPTDQHGVFIVIQGKNQCKIVL